MSDMNMHDVIAALSAPTPDEDVGWVSQGRGAANPYVDVNFVIGRLNEVVGLDWSDHYEDIKDAAGATIAVDCYLTVCGVTRVGRGTPSNFEGEKGGHSDALKRAARKFGVGLDVFAGDHPVIARGNSGYTEKPFHKRQRKHSQAKQPEAAPPAPTQPERPYSPEDLRNMIAMSAARRAEKDETLLKVAGDNRHPAVWATCNALEELFRGNRDEKVEMRKLLTGYLVDEPSTKNMTIAQLNTLLAWATTQPARAEAERVVSVARSSASMDA